MSIDDRDDEYWWYGEKCSNDDFSDRLASMLISEVSAVISETSDVIGRLNRFANDGANEHTKRAEAQRSVTLVGEKRKMARRAATRLHAQLETENKDRLDRLDDLLHKVDLLADENPSAAMHTLIAALRTYWKIDELLERADRRIDAIRESEPEQPKPPPRSSRPKRSLPAPEVLIARRR